MIPEMRKTFVCHSYAEKLRRVAELIEFSRRFKAVKSTGNTARAWDEGKFASVTEQPTILA